MLFWNSFAFSMTQQMLAVWFLVPLPFLIPACTFVFSWFTYCWSLGWRILNTALLACEISTNEQQFEYSLALPFFFFFFILSKIFVIYEVLWGIQFSPWWLLHLVEVFLFAWWSLALNSLWLVFIRANPETLTSERPCDAFVGNLGMWPILGSFILYRTSDLMQ